MSISGQDEPTDHEILILYDDEAASGGPHEFLISKERLAEIVENINNKDHLPLQNIVSALKTNIDAGIIGDEADLHLRREAFGSNLISTSQLERSSSQTIKSFKQHLLNALRDPIVILLLCCATLSLVIGMKTNGLNEALIDAAMIFLAISLVASFGAMFRFLKARWMIKKSSSKHSKIVCVVRNGNLQKISESQVVVGDILCLQTGDEVPADGIFIDGDNSFQLSDGSGQAYGPPLSPSIFTGSKVVKGQCRLLVTSVGENTERNRLIRQQQNDHHHKPKLELLEAVDKTNSKLEMIWLSLSLLLLTAQLIWCFVSRPSQIDRDRNLDPKGVKNPLEDLMNESIQLMRKERSKANSGLVTMLCILIFASRDGLPLAIFVSLLYASYKMKSCQAMIQKLPASATMGLVTTICCIGRTGDIVLQHEKMAELWVGFSLIDDLQKQVHNRVLDVLQESIFIHSKMGQGDQNNLDISLFIWATAVLAFNNVELKTYQEYCSVVQYEAADHMDRNLSCLVVKKDSGGANDCRVVHVHWRGAPELIVCMCSHYYNADGIIETIDDRRRAAFLQVADNIVASESHQCCFAFAYKQQSPQDEEESNDDDDNETMMIKPLEHGLILLGLVGLKNPYTPDLRQAIQDCRKSGVDIKLLVEDDVNTARIMALNCGLLRPDDDQDDNNIIEAADFRSSSEQDRRNMVDKIHVMANSSPADKLWMIQSLRQKGEIVAATASCLRDSPLLKAADVGILVTHHDQGAELMSKDDCDIILLHNNFSRIPGIINLGRRVCENLEKIIVLQLTREISAFAVNFIAAFATSSDEFISSFQFVWINLIMEIVGALAVAIITIHVKHENKSEQVYGPGRVIITRTMCRNIAVQSIFQVSVILVLGMKGKEIFNVNDLTLKTTVCNCFVFCQVFLLIQAIELEKNNVLGGIFVGKNCLFLGIVAIIGVLQVMLIEIMTVVAHLGKLDLQQWCIIIGIASLSLPLSCATNWIPHYKQKWWG